MARHQKNTVDYFPFICEDGKKMYYIEETYGNDGFATFVKILRELAKTEYHYLDLSKNTTLMFLSAKCKISKETLILIINDLVDLDKFNLMLWQENRVIWCQDFIDSIQDAYFKRKNKCITFEGLLLLLESLGVRKSNKSTLKVPINTQTILEDTILNKTKENIPTPTAFSFYNSLIDLGGEKTIINDWIKVRKAKKMTNTETAFNGFKKQLELSGNEINQVLTLCVEKSWGGFKSEWMPKIETQEQGKPFGKTNQI